MEQENVTLKGAENTIKYLNQLKIILSLKLRRICRPKKKGIFLKSDLIFYHYLISKENVMFYNL